MITKDAVRLITGCSRGLGRALTEQVSRPTTGSSSPPVRLPEPGEGGAAGMRARRTDHRDIKGRI